MFVGLYVSVFVLKFGMDRTSVLKSISHQAFDVVIKSDMEFSTDSLSIFPFSNCAFSLHGILELG